MSPGHFFTLLRCDYTNEVDAGCWVGGVVGLKNILEAKSRRAESSLFYHKYGSFETKADGMILVCEDGRRNEIAKQIIRQTMWGRKTLLTVPKSYGIIVATRSVKSSDGV